MLRTRTQGLEARDRSVEGGGKTKKRKNPHKSCKRDVGTGGDSVWAEKGNKHSQESVGPIGTDPDGLKTARQQGEKCKTIRV